MAEHNGGRRQGENAAYDARATLGEVQDMPLSCNARDAGRILGVSTMQVQRLAKRGELPGCKVGGQWRFSTPLLVNMVEGRLHCVAPRR